MTKFEGKEVRGDGPKDLYALRRIRTGKTKRDKDSGAYANRMKNRAARNEWCNNRNAKASQHPSGNR